MRRRGAAVGGACSPSPARRLSRRRERSGRAAQRPLPHPRFRGLSTLSHTRLGRKGPVCGPACGSKRRRARKVRSLTAGLSRSPPARLCRGEDLRLRLCDCADPELVRVDLARFEQAPPGQRFPFQDLPPAPSRFAHSMRHRLDPDPAPARGRAGHIFGRKRGAFAASAFGGHRRLRTYCVWSKAVAGCCTR